MVELTPHGAAWTLGIAGDTLNTAWYARAMLPAEWQVAYVTRLGLDPFSTRALGFMAENGIDTTEISRHPSRHIGLYAISLHEGERSFTYWRETSAARTLHDAAPQIEAAIARAGALHVSGITLAILPPEARAWLVAQMAKARVRGALVSLDPNHRPRLWPDAKTARMAITAAAGAASVLLPGFDDEAALFGDPTPQATRARYASLGAETVVVKTGGAALHLAHRGEVTDLTLPVVPPLDTTGAGDSFNGGFLAALLQGATPEAAARQAHALASRVVRHPGALIPMGELR